MTWQICSLRRQVRQLERRCDRIQQQGPPSASSRDVFAAIVTAAGLPAPIREHRFAPPRLWRFDLAWPSLRAALEIEGGTWTAGRHVRGKGYENDCEKYNAAALGGWCVLRVTTSMIQDGRALALLEQALSAGRAVSVPPT